MRVLVLAAAMVLVASIAHAELVAKDLIFNTDTSDGEVVFSIKSTNIPGTYFWYDADDRCTAKVKGKSLDVTCPDAHWVMAPDAGDITITADNEPKKYVAYGSIGHAMFLTIMVDNKRRHEK